MLVNNDLSGFFEAAVLAGRRHSLPPRIRLASRISAPSDLGMKLA
jgi:hypothetical protein